MHPKIVAVGECGLDYQTDACDKVTQLFVFMRHFSLAEKCDYFGYTAKPTLSSPPVDAPAPLVDTHHSVA